MKYTVYKITKKDGLEYIGQTVNLKDRLRRHRGGALKKKFFKEGMEHEILAEFDTREEALALEKKLVTAEYISRPNTLNKREGGNTNSFKGKNRPQHSQCMKSKPDKGVGHLNTPEIKAKAKATKNTLEAREHSRAIAKGNTNVRGRKWYNDGKKSFMLKPTDQRILGGILKQGRLKW